MIKAEKLKDRFTGIRLSDSVFHLICRRAVLATSQSLHRFYMTITISNRPSPHASVSPKFRLGRFWCYPLDVEGSATLSLLLGKNYLCYRPS